MTNDPSSWWQTSTPKLGPSKKTPDEIDFLIIGGGLSAVSLAYWLFYFGKAKNVVILEKEYLGFGASGRNAGFMTRGSAHYFYTLCGQFGVDKAKIIWDQMAENHKLLVHHILGSNPHPKYMYAKQGSWTLTKNSQEYDLYTSFLDEVKIPYQTLEPNMLANNAQNYNSKAIFLKESESSINPMTLVHGIYTKAKGINKNIFWIKDSLESYEFQSIKGKVIAKLASTNQLMANNMIIATNGYTQDLRLPQASISVAPIIAQMQKIQVEFNPDDHLSMNLYGNYYDPEAKVYFRQISKDELVIGGLRLIDEETEVGTAHILNSKIQKALLSYAKTNIFHPNAKLSLKQMWCGVMGFTSSNEPIIRSDPQNRRTYFFAGFNGHGLGLIFYHAKEFSQKFSEASF